MMETILKIYEYADKSVKKRFNGIDIKELLQSKSLEEVIELICLDSSVIEMIDEFSIFEEFVSFLRQMKISQSNKIIQSLTRSDLEFSRGRLNNYSLSEEEIKLIFQALVRNIIIYEKLYMQKVYKIETTLNQNVLLNIGHAKLFHLLGFNLYDWQREYRTQILRVIPEMREVLDKDYIRMCRENDTSLLRAIITIIKREGDIISAISTGDLSDKVFTSPKIKTKNFAFERLGLIESPTGIVFYTTRPFDKIKSDVFVLRDFVRDYNLNWIFNGYAHQIGVELENHRRVRPKNAETLLIEPDNTSRLNGQLVGISSAVGSMNRSQFDFKVSTLTSIDDASKFIKTEHQFHDIDIKLMASKIVSHFPDLDLTHLKHIISSGRNR